MKGKLIIIEAGDGSGKATQTKALYDHLKADGHKVHRIEFPDYAVNAFAASTFFAVDRFASYQRKWRDYYENGDIILADRYTTSNMVHQAVKLTDKAEREAFLDWLWDFEFVKMGLPVPDKVIFLDMAPEVADKLIAARAAETATKKDIHERDTDYLHRCHAAYLELADKYKWDKVICNAGENPRSIDAIHQDVYALVEQMLKK